MSVSVDLINSAALAASLHGAAPIHLQGESLEEGDAQFCLAEDFLSAHQLYRDGDCMGNVMRFLRYLPVNTETDRLNVIEVLHSSIKSSDDFYGLRDDRKIWPKASLIPDKWKYHVVLELGGRVYDFDYQGEPATPLPVYAEHMFGSAMACFDYIVIPRRCLLGQGCVNIFDRSFLRMPILDFVMQQENSYGRLAPLGVERREDNFERWGLMREHDVFQTYSKSVKARVFCLTYEAGRMFNLDNFATLLGQALILTKRERPRLTSGSVDIWLRRPTLISEGELRSIVNRVVRPIGISGRIEIVVMDSLNPLPRTFTFDG